MKSKSVSLAVLALLTLPSAYGFAQERVNSQQVPARASASTPQATPVAARSNGNPADLLIGDGDLLEVSLYGMPDFKTDVLSESIPAVRSPCPCWVL